MAAFAGIIVNSCCGKDVAAVAVIARTTVIFAALITAKFIAALVCSECRVVNVVAVIQAMMWLLLQGLL